MIINMQIRHFVETYIQDNFEFYTENLVDFIINMLENNESIRWAVFDDVNKEYHRIDLVDELEYRNICVDNIAIDKLLEVYEDALGDSEDWHIILNNVIDRYCEDKND